MLLWPALEATKHFKLPVLELGSGEGSTSYLRTYCTDADIPFMSYDSDQEWAKSMGSIWVPDWRRFSLWENDFSVCLLDLAPGEYRKTALMKLLNTKVIVVHDSEPKGWNASNYQVRELFEKFEYIKDFESPKPGAWATALSNTIDVTKFTL